MVIGGNTLPRTGLDWYAKAPGMVDIIGLSVSEFYAACPVAHRSIYSADGSVFYDAATIIANIEASAELNDGGELVGSVAKGYAQYADGTVESVLRKAYRYFGISYPDVDPNALTINLAVLTINSEALTIGA